MEYNLFPEFRVPSILQETNDTQRAKRKEQVVRGGILSSMVILLRRGYCDGCRNIYGISRNHRVDRGNIVSVSRANDSFLGDTV